MYCKRAVLVNWGNIPAQEFEFGPINLFSGGNGSGKTTAADALQSLMTAAHENLFNFNPGQDETTQRGRGGKQVRTLQSYVLGCDDGSYARPRTCDGYIVGNFHPTQGEDAEKFVALMCMRASLDTAGSSRQARLDELQFIIISGEEVFLSDIVKQDKGGKYIVPQQDLRLQLMKKFGRDRVEVYDKKGPYLRRLYGIFRGERAGVSDREAKHAARTFSNFMAYKPVKSITDFVAREVLEPKDLSDDIKEVSELMKTISAMEQDTRQLNDAINNLEQAQNHSQIYISAWQNRALLRYAEAARQAGFKQRDYLNELKNQSEKKTLIAEYKQKNTLLSDKRTSLQEELVELTAQRQGISALKDKDQLERDIQRLQSELGQLVVPLVNEDQQISLNLRSAVQLAEAIKNKELGAEFSKIDLKDLALKLKRLIDAGSDSGINAQNLQTRDWVNNDALESKLTSIAELELLHNQLADMIHLGEQSPADQLYLNLHRLNEQRDKAKAQFNLKQQEIQKLQQQRVSYPAHVESAVQAIKHQCPDARPAVLCDFIDIKDPDWQMAIEGYLGGARFGIVVEPEYEAEAIQIVRRLPGRRNNARVIQGSKAQRDAQRLQTDGRSIVDVMRFEHKIVEYYVRASYASVKRVDSAEQLRGTARGLTRDGMGSGSYSMFRCDIDEADLVFGQGARERALTAKQDQLIKLQQQAQQFEQQSQKLSELRNHLANFKSIHCSKLIQNMLQLHQSLTKNEHALANLNLEDFAELEQKLEHIKTTLKELEHEAQQLSKQSGAAENELRNSELRASRLSSEQEQLADKKDSAEQAVVKLASYNSDFNAQVELAQADENAKGSNNFNEEASHAQRELERNERRLYECVLEHNRSAQRYNSLQYQALDETHETSENYAAVLGMQDEIQRIYNSLKNNVLVGKHEKLVVLRDSFNTTFVTNLCHSIFQSINDGKRCLEELNRELEHHRFGADRERFYFSWDWLPEFREYWHFFKEIIKSPSLGDGNNLFEVNLDKRATEVRDKLLSMLLDKDEQSALNELKRISDYRNYRRYEIFKEPLNKQPIPLSTYGTGSGGQLETPAYIIRSAAITSAFRFNEGRSHCRMVLVDEAFSKMDETRSREVINYLTESLGLQLVFIMPSSKSGPFMDLISHQVVFSKCPSAVAIGELNTRVLVDRKTCNQDKIKDLWAKHRSTIRNQASLDFMEGIV
ncbi:ATP-binding protein [Agaribacterium haliotis]|uniref:ATP-binding protein n=1 Tax=Agaribacterium haliotis TaxID=2013869 RepID=UPI000BB546FB|nr:SbcC/MukB-like Walker B domain-containing protein [Agaribacterium haliotis]